MFLQSKVTVEMPLTSVRVSLYSEMGSILSYIERNGQREEGIMKSLETDYFSGLKVLVYNCYDK